MPEVFGSALSYRCELLSWNGRRWRMGQRVWPMAQKVTNLPISS